MVHGKITGFPPCFLLTESFLLFVIPATLYDKPNTLCNYTSQIFLGIVWVKELKVPRDFKVIGDWSEGPQSSKEREMEELRWRDNNMTCLGKLFSWWDLIMRFRHFFCYISLVWFTKRKLLFFVFFYGHKKLKFSMTFP